MALFDALVKPALDSVTALVAQFHLSPEQKAQADEAIQAAAQKAQDDAEDYDAKLNDIAGQNIRADSQNGDKFTRRARPLFMYVIEAVFAFNYIVIPLAGIFGSKYAPIVLPGDLLTLFGVCVTGYVFNRTAEKIASVTGNQQVSVWNALTGSKS